MQSLGTLWQLWLNDNYFWGPREGFMNTNSNDSIVQRQVSSSLNTDIRLKMFLVKCKLNEMKWKWNESENLGKFLSGGAK